MKIQLDSVLKVIRIEENVNLGELVKYLDKLLPKSSPIGYWKDFKLETNTVIYNWSSPFTFTYGNEITFPATIPTTCNSEVSTSNGVITDVVSRVYNVELN